MQLKEIKNGNLNSVFKLELNNKNYIIRVSDFNNDFESEILKILENNKINTPRIKTKFIFENKYVMICDYINGEHPFNYNYDFFSQLITEVKKINGIDIRYINQNNNNFESIEKMKEYYNISINSKFLRKERSFIDNIIYIIEENLKLERLPQALIHSDIKKENVLVDDKKVYLIDFGNCYFGNRLIDVLRIIMWFFISEDNYDFEKIKEIVNLYFNENNQITKIELDNIELLLNFCLLYNLLKDIYLYEKRLLPEKYITMNSLKWLKTLKEKDNLKKIVEVFYDFKRFAK